MASLNPSPSSRAEFMVPLLGTDDGERTICVRQQGTGPDVVLIAGLGADLEIWADLPTRLSTGYRLTTFDSQGVGRSPRGPGDLTIERLADDTSRLCAALGIEAAHVVGSSMGGAVAQQLAIRDPGRVATLTLIGSWAGPDLHLQRLLRHFAWLCEALADPGDLAGAFALWEYSGQAHAGGVADLQISRALASRRPGQTSVDYGDMTNAALAHDARALLSRLENGPALVLVGSEDRVCPPRLSHELAELIPHATLALLPHLGHLPFIEQPETVAERLEAFWTSHGGV